MDSENNQDQNIINLTEDNENSQNKNKNVLQNSNKEDIKLSINNDLKECEKWNKKNNNKKKVHIKKEIKTQIKINKIALPNNINNKMDLQNEEK